MRYETIQKLKDEDFKRLTGVQRNTFGKMLEVVEKGLRDFGRPPKLSRADLWCQRSNGLSHDQEG
jgi:hypothetical protein